jgi:hypothetical protein
MRAFISEGGAALQQVFERRPNTMLAFAVDRRLNRMVAGSGCRGLQQSELSSLAVPLSDGAHRRLACDFCPDSDDGRCVVVVRADIITELNGNSSVFLQQISSCPTISASDDDSE